MTALQTIEQIGNKAVQKLRLQKLRSGHPFMINSKELEPNQCFLEYPDGTIQLVYLKNIPCCTKLFSEIVMSAFLTYLYTASTKD